MSFPQQISRSTVVFFLDFHDLSIHLSYIQLYEEDARIGHREFDLKLTQRVKMSMVSLFRWPLERLMNTYQVGVPEMAFNFWAASVYVYLRMSGRD
jgi:MutS domain I